VQFPLQYCGVFSKAEETKGMLEATTAPIIGNTSPAAFLKNPLREIISLSFFML
jgi:hypothetical protein